jgi:hypothetical protein
LVFSPICFLHTFFVDFSDFLPLLLAPVISSRTLLASVLTDSSSELSSDAFSSSEEENRLAPDFLEETLFFFSFSGSPLLLGVPVQKKHIVVSIKLNRVFYFQVLKGYLP